MPHISVVIPSYNEELNLTELYGQIMKTLPSLRITWEIIFVDDGSKDNTWGKILSLRERNSDIFQPGHFGLFYGGNLNAANLKKILKHLPKTGICELTCHPGCEDKTSQYRHR